MGEQFASETKTPNKQTNNIHNLNEGPCNLNQIKCNKNSCSI